MQNSLYRPFVFNNDVIAKNRMVLAPMTNGQGNQDGSLGEAELAWLTRFSQGNFGVVITCASHVTLSGKAWEGQLGIYDDHLLPGLKKLANMFKEHHTLGLVQIFHGGARSGRTMTGVQPVSASAFQLDIPGFEAPRALSIPEIQEIIEEFAKAAERAYKAGFAGVEIHGANGYIVAQFISTQTNLRTDEYGGSLENRARFAREIVRACRGRVPSHFLVGIRLSPEATGAQSGLDLDENIQIAKWLLEDGIDFLDLSLLSALSPSQKYPSHPKPVVQYFKEALGVNFPVFAGGGIRMPSQAKKLMAFGSDFVTLGVTAIGNADWAKQAEHENYQPMLPPYPVAYLKQLGLRDQFIDYISSLPMVVEQTSGRP